MNEKIEDIDITLAEEPNILDEVQIILEEMHRVPTQYANSRQGPKDNIWKKSPTSSSKALRWDP